jgi:integral membrane protein
MVACPAMSWLGRFRAISIVEGLSYLALVGVAVPLKYAAGEPRAVQVLGPIHGVLFIAFIICANAASHGRTWDRRRWLLILAAAFLPFATFVLERALAREQDAERARS